MIFLEQIPVSFLKPILKLKYMFVIRKEFAFSASHQLKGLPDTHPCSRLHGHNYVVTVELRSEWLNEVGFIKDYRSLEPVKRWIDEVLDHKHLNDVLGLDKDKATLAMINPTAENMSKLFFDLFKEWIPELYAVEVSETPKTSARYERS
jgi:6-pyruvoyltetrahydropterin/6-carboxytetrahydropterin synthase